MKTRQPGARTGGAGEQQTRRRGRPRRVNRGSDPIDVHVGARLRERRVHRDMSQTALGERLGLTFQQVQKYERGANRLSASKLWRAAEALEVPVGFFFDGLNHNKNGDQPLPEDPQALLLTRRMRSLDPQLRERLSALITVLIRRG